jgi:hypothetical protein
MALLVTTTTGLNHIIGVQKRRASRLFGLLRLFEASSINSAGALAMSPLPSEGIAAMKYEYAYEGLHALERADATKRETRTEFASPQIVPQQWLVWMRLALVSFMTTAWFLSRSYTITMYLVLGLATAAIALQGGERKSADHGHWIFSTITAEVLIIFLIYGLVRLRH